MTWLVIITILWLLAEGAVPKASRYSLSQNGNSNINTLCKIGLILTLTLMVGFWGLVAQDHEMYVGIYQLLSHYTLSDVLGNITDIFRRQAMGMELGYNIINVLASSLGLKPPLFLTLVALLVNTCIIKFIYDYPHPILSLFLLVSMNFFLMEANLVRQVFAMAIFLISIQFLLKGNWKKYLLLIFVATLFHVSAVALGIFAVFLVPKSHETQKYALITLIFSWLVSLLIMSGFVSFNLLSVLSDSTYSIYTKGGNSISMEVSLLNIVFHNVIVIASLLCFKSLKINYKLIYYAVIITTASIVNCSYSLPNIFRFATYFNVAFFAFTIFIFQKSGKWRLGNYSIPILFLQVYCGIRLFTSFILEENIFGSESYSLSDFF